MGVSKNQFQTSDTQTRKKHEVTLTVDSPSSEGNGRTTSAQNSVHTSPTPKAFEAREERRAELANRPKREVLKNKETVAQEAVSEEAVATKEKVVEAAANNAPVAPMEEVKTEAKAEEITYPVHSTSSEATEEAAPEEAPIKKKKKFRLGLLEKKALSGWLFVLPFVIGIIFVYAPIVWNSIMISFSDVKFTSNGMELTWNNFANYTYMFNEDKWFAKTLIDGLKDLVLQIPAIVIFSLFMAIILNQKMTGRAVFRAIFFLPVILSTGIIDSIDSNSAFMAALENSQGGVDNNTGEEAGGIISALDIESLLGGIKIGTELVTYVVSLVNNIFDIVSRSGVQMLVFLSGLQSISPAIYESCEVEGASAWETFWKITLPMISPMILVNAIYTVIDAFTCADNRVMSYIQKEFYGKSFFAVSSTASWVYVGVVLVFIILVALIMKTVVFYQRRD